MVKESAKEPQSLEEMMRMVIAANKKAVQNASTATAERLKTIDHHIGLKLRSLDEKMDGFEAEQREAKARSMATDSKVEQQAKAHEELCGKVAEL